MKTLNRKFKGIRRTTDVLAFSQLEGEQPVPRWRRPLIGDVVISVDCARRQAPRYGNTEARELVLYMIHGVLHLLGHDDTKPGPRRKMRRREKAILAQIERRFLR